MGDEKTKKRLGRPPGSFFGGNAITMVLVFGFCEQSPAPETRFWRPSRFGGVDDRDCSGGLPG